ncbi:MAG: ASPIC/UnbV domain-containing protein [Verrucomicrobiales bacterium]
MLSDPSKSEAFRKSPHWRSPLLNFQLRVKQDRGLSLTGDDGPAWRSNSFSGHERNRLLLKRPDAFSDLSLVSGVDCREDARSFAMLDFDSDGWLDIALMSTNAPRFRLFRNRIGALTATSRLFTVHLEGGNHAAANSELSNRDAGGATVLAVTSIGRRIFRRSLGEGLASQNAAAIRVTLAPGEELHELQINWPSGKQTTHRPEPRVPALQLREREP